MLVLPWAPCSSLAAQTFRTAAGEGRGLLGSIHINHMGKHLNVSSYKGFGSLGLQLTNGVCFLAPAEDTGEAVDEDRFLQLKRGLCC